MSRAPPLDFKEYSDSATISKISPRSNCITKGLVAILNVG